MSIEAVDRLPDPARGQHDWDGLAEKGRNAPGQWFRMPIGHRSYATFVRQGKFKAFENDSQDWEVETRELDGETFIYVRYMCGL